MGAWLELPAMSTCPFLLFSFYFSSTETRTIWCGSSDIRSGAAISAKSVLKEEAAGAVTGTLGRPRRLPARVLRRQPGASARASVSRNLKHPSTTSVEGKLEPGGRGRGGEDGEVRTHGHETVFGSGPKIVGTGGRKMRRSTSCAAALPDVRELTQARRRRQDGRPSGVLARADKFSSREGRATFCRESAGASITLLLQHGLAFNSPPLFPVTLSIFRLSISRWECVALSRQNEGRTTGLPRLPVFDGSFLARSVRCHVE